MNEDELKTRIKIAVGCKKYIPTSDEIIPIDFGLYLKPLEIFDDETMEQFSSERILRGWQESFRR